VHAYEYYISIPTIDDEYRYKINIQSYIRTMETLKQQCIKFLLDFTIKLPTYQTWYRLQFTISE